MRWLVLIALLTLGVAVVVLSWSGGGDLDVMTLTSWPVDGELTADDDVGVWSGIATSGNSQVVLAYTQAAGSFELAGLEGGAVLWRRPAGGNPGCLGTIKSDGKNQILALADPWLETLWVTWHAEGASERWEKLTVPFRGPEAGPYFPTVVAGEVPDGPVVLVQVRPDDGPNAIHALHLGRSPVSFEKMWAGDRATGLGTYDCPSSKVLVDVGGQLDIRDLASPEVRAQVEGAPGVSVYRAFETPDGGIFLMTWHDWSAPFEVLGVDAGGAVVSRLQPWPTATPLEKTDMFAGPGGRPMLVAVRGGIIEAATISKDGTECRRNELVPAADILDGGLEIDQLSAAYTPDGFVHLLCQVNHRHHVDFRYMRVRLDLDAEQSEKALGSQF